MIGRESASPVSFLDFYRLPPWIFPVEVVADFKNFLYDTDLYHIFITDKITHEKTQFFISFSKILYYFLEYETDCRI